VQLLSEYLLPGCRRLILPTTPHYDHSNRESVTKKLGPAPVSCGPLVMMTHANASLRPQSLLRPVTAPSSDNTCNALGPYHLLKGVLMKRFSKTGLTLFISATLLCVNTAAFADRNSLSSGWNFLGNANSSGFSTQTSSTHLSASLTGVTGFPGAGTLFYATTSRGGSLEAHLHLPVDGATILDSNTAATSTYTLTVSNGASVVATCTLNITDIDFTYTNGATTPTEVAEYQVGVAEVGATVTTRIGSCGASFPVLVAGDTISVSSNGGASTTPVLTGVLAATVTHHR
jgi:hypothetical protein